MEAGTAYGLGSLKTLDDLKRFVEALLEANAPMLRQLVGAGQNFYSGTGTPEGIVTAPVGAVFQRLDGGAGTSFYVKETGTDNTGWVGK